MELVGYRIRPRHLLELAKTGISTVHRKLSSDCSILPKSIRVQPLLGVGPSSGPRSVSEITFE